MSKLILDYQIGSLLGKGGYGSVYKGVNIQTGEYVAIKQITLSAIPKDQIGGIMTEIDLLKKLRHDNIVKYLGYKKTKDYLYIILEFVENGSLQSIVQSFGRFPETLVRVYISQVLTGLLYLHDQGVIHRDIKGANILTTKKGHVKLADFGVAVDKREAQSESNSVAGTPYWMAPEIIELTGASPKSDIWSVGCTVIELLTQKPPYFDLDPMQALFRIVRDDHPPIPGDISGALRDFLMECFQKDPLLRIDATGLLKHPWIKSNTVIQTPITTDFEDVQQTIKQHNEEKAETINRLPRGFPVTKKPKPASPAPNYDDFSFEPEKPVKAPTPKKSPASRGKNKRFPKQPRRVEESPPIDDGDWDAIEIDSPKPAPKQTKSQKPKPTSTKPADDDVWDDDFATSKPVASKPTPSKSKTKPFTHPSKAAIQKSVDEDNWDDDFEPKSTKPPAKTPVVDEDNWDDDFEPVKPSKSSSKPFKKPSKAPKKSVPVQKIDDEDNWDDDFEPKSQKPAAKKPVVDEDNWDDDFETLKKPVKKHTPKPKPVANDDDGDNWDDDFDSLSITAKPQDPEEETWDDLEFPTVKHTPKPKANANDDDWDDFDLTPVRNSDDSSSSSLGGLGGIDFAAKLQQFNAPKDEESEEEDGFDNIFDEEDFQAGRDNFLALSNEVSQLLQLLAPSNDSDIIQSASSELILLFSENPYEKSRLIRRFGVIQILELLETTSTNNLYCIIQLVNQIVEGNREIQENFCLVGGIPTILHFADSRFPKDIRLEVARFVKLVCSGSSLTHQMFIACRGLPSLVGFLETSNYLSDKDLVFMATDGIQSVFELQSSTPKNDFCRLFIKYNTLKFLANALLNAIRDTNPDTEPYKCKLLDILLYFSAGDAIVKSKMADDTPGGVLGVLFTCVELLKAATTPTYLVTLVKSIKQLSTDSTTYTPLQNVGAVPRLVTLFKAPAHIVESQDLINQLVSSLYNLTRIDRVRQEQAARAGIIPHLKELIDKNSPLKQFALEILLDIGRTPGGRAELWKYDGVEYFLGLLTEVNWKVTALEVLASWLADERKVQNVISQSNNIAKLVNVFVATTGPMFVQLVSPILKVVQVSVVISKCISTNKEFVQTVLDNLLSPNHSANVRVNLMRILINLFENHPNAAMMISELHLDEIVKTLKEDRILFVQELASQLEAAFQAAGEM